MFWAGSLVLECGRDSRLSRSLFLLASCELHHFLRKSREPALQGVCGCAGERVKGPLTLEPTHETLPKEQVARTAPRPLASSEQAWPDVSGDDRSEIVACWLRAPFRESGFLAELQQAPGPGTWRVATHSDSRSTLGSGCSSQSTGKRRVPSQRRRARRRKRKRQGEGQGEGNSSQIIKPGNVEASGLSVNLVAPELSPAPCKPAFAPAEEWGLVVTSTAQVEPGRVSPSRGESAP